MVMREDPMSAERCHTRTATLMRRDPVLTWEEMLPRWCPSCLVVTNVLQLESNALGVLGPDRLARYTRVLFDQYPCTQV